MIEPDVFVNPGSCSPATRTGLNPGSRQTWYWATSGTGESVTSTTIPLFDSGTKYAGTFAFTFFAAGSFRYESSSDGSQRGSISVRMCNLPSSARVGSHVYMQYGSVHHTHWATDIEVKRPGAVRWSWLAYGLTGTATSFTPARTGTYYLRARLRRTTSNASSRFSPKQAVKVS